MSDEMKELRRRLTEDRNDFLSFGLSSEAAGVQQAISELDEFVGDGDDE